MSSNIVQDSQQQCIVMSMKIYVAHSSGFDFQKELYSSIKNSAAAQEHTFIFPHENSSEPFNSKDLFENECDLVLAEVSYPSTGLGIELGWAEMLGIPVVCIYKTGSKISNALTKVSKTFLEYGDEQELQKAIEKAVKA